MFSIGSSVFAMRIVGCYVKPSPVAKPSFSKSFSSRSRINRPRQASNISDARSSLISPAVTNSHCFRCRTKSPSRGCTPNPHFERARQIGRRHAVAIPVTARVGAHQPDRRLPLAQQHQGRRGKVQAVATDNTGLTCFIFRFLRRPQKGNGRERTMQGVGGNAADPIPASWP